MAASFVQKAEALAISAGSLAIAYAGDVTNGNLLTFEVARYTGAVSDPIVVGDMTKTAGTATIGTIVLDKTIEVATDAANIINVAIFSVLVTGTGSCTLTVTGNAGEFWWGNISEWSGLPGPRGETNSNNGNSTAVDSGNVSTNGAALILGLMGCSTGANITITEDGAFTLLNEQELGATTQTGSSIYRLVATGTTDSASWTLDVSRIWGAVVVTYNENGSSGSGTAITGLGRRQIVRPQ
jgi:hypothetical protein